MKNNRIHTILIALALSMTMLVGCGRSGSAEVTAAPTAAPVPPGAAEPATSLEAVIRLRKHLFRPLRPLRPCQLRLLRHLRPPRPCQLRLLRRLHRIHR